jgi:hypothetical protein
MIRHITSPRGYRHRYRHRYRHWLALTALLAGVACTQLPELEATIPDHLRDAPYPELQPLDEALFAVPLPQEQSAEIEQSLSARARRLQARARDLNTTVVDPAARKRMQSGVTR